jgi:hypothetical protein
VILLTTRLDVAHHAVNGTFPLDVMCMGAVGAAAYYAAPGADDVKAPSITTAPDPVVDEDDGADFVASGPSCVADLGAGSVRSAGATRPRRGRRVRRRHDRRAAPGKRARGGRRRLAPFQPRARRRPSPRIPGHRPVLIRCPLPCHRATTALSFARRSYDRAIPGPRPTADPAGGPVGVLEAVPTAEPGAHGPSSTPSIHHRRNPDAHRRDSRTHTGALAALRRAGTRSVDTLARDGAEGAPWRRRVVEPLWPLRKR